MDGKKRTVAKKLQPSMYITSPYFKDGGTLLNDLAFSCHYHFTTVHDVDNMTRVETLFSSTLHTAICWFAGEPSHSPELGCHPHCWHSVDP